MEIFIIIAVVCFLISGLCAWGIIRWPALAWAMFGVAAYLAAGVNLTGID